MSCFLSYNLIGLTGDCTNISGGSFSIEISGTSPDYRIEWLTPLSGTTLLGPGVNVYTETGLSAGTYTFNIKDSCTDPGNTTITASIYISSGVCSSITSVSNTSCGLDNGSLTATTQYDYGGNVYLLYHSTLGYVTSGTTNLPSGCSFDGLFPGTYYVRVIDDGGCSASTNSVIVQTSSELDFGLYVINDSGCNLTSGKIFVTGLTGNPPYTYLWSNGETGDSISGLSVGSYSVTVTDNGGCSVSKSGSVGFVPSVGQAGVYVVQPSCFASDGRVTVVVSGGTAPYFYSGSNGNVVVDFSNTIEFNNLPGGNFSYYVQDSALCKFTGSVNLITPSSFNIVSITTTNSTCGNNQGSITINVTSGSPPYVYKLTDSNNNDVSITSSFPTYTFNSLSSDEYTLSISDGSSCEYINTYTIENDPLFTVDIETTGTTCGGSNGMLVITVTDGTGPYVYEVNGESITSNLTTASFSNLQGGSYLVSVTDTSESCIQSQTVNIGSSNGVNFVYNAITPNGGDNGSIEIFIVQGQAPFIIEWSDNVNGQYGLSVENLSPGTYTVKVTDYNGCIKQGVITFEGISCSVSYEVFNIGESEFNNNGQLLKKGLLLMLNEGFADLTIGDTDCILNQSEFEAIVSVSGVTTSQMFFTGNTLSEVPTDNDFANVVSGLLLSYSGISDVNIDLVNNKITITNDCDSEINLMDSQVVVNLIIHYDISCLYCNIDCDYPVVNCDYNSFCDVNTFRFERYLPNYDFIDDVTQQPTCEQLQYYVCGSETVLDQEWRDYRDDYIYDLYDNEFKLYEGYSESEVPNDLTPYIEFFTNPDNETLFNKSGLRKVNNKWWGFANEYPIWYDTNVFSGVSFNDVFSGVTDFTYLRPVDNISLAPVGVPGDLILTTGITSDDYFWVPLNPASSGFPETNTWVSTGGQFEDLQSVRRARRNAYTKAKNEFYLAFRPYLYASYYLPRFQMIKYKGF